MPSVVLHLHAHLPLRLRRYSFFDIGRSPDYFDEEESRANLHRTAEGCLLPVNVQTHKLIRRHRGRFRVSCTVSGMLLEQMETWQKPLLESFQKLAETGCAEFVCEPSHHSLASLFSETEYRQQVALHRRMVRTRFGQVPRAFRNTEGICDRDAVRVARSLGFRVILGGGIGRLRGCDVLCPCIPAESGRRETLVLYNRRSEDVIPRGAGGEGSDLAAGEVADGLVGTYYGDEIVYLFMDVEPFGEQGAGALGFLETFPGLILKRRNWRFLTLSGAAMRHRLEGAVAGSSAVPRSGFGQDAAAWLGNHLQQDAAKTLYAMEGPIRQTGSRKLLDTWRKLQTSDHFWHMNTRGLPAGADHRTGNPFASPYDAYIHYMNILKDFSGRIGRKSGVRL